MKSNRNYNRIGLFAVAVLAVCFSAMPANAQLAAAKGSFTLSHEVHWGAAALPAGDYTFSLDSQAGNGILTVCDGKTRHAVALIRTGVREDKTSSPTSDLVLVYRHGKAFVRAMELKEMGVTLFYILPKGERQFLAEGPVLYQRVELAMNGQ
jgi:hypothetical protein